MRWRHHFIDYSSLEILQLLCNFIQSKVRCFCKTMFVCWLHKMVDLSFCGCLWRGSFMLFKSLHNNCMFLCMTGSCRRFSKQPNLLRFGGNVLLSGRTHVDKQFYMHANMLNSHHSDSQEYILHKFCKLLLLLKLRI